MNLLTRDIQITLYLRLRRLFAYLFTASAEIRVASCVGSSAGRHVLELSATWPIKKDSDGRRLDVTSAWPNRDWLSAHARNWRAHSATVRCTGVAYSPAVYERLPLERQIAVELLKTT